MKKTYRCRRFRILYIATCMNTLWLDHTPTLGLMGQHTSNSREVKCVIRWIKSLVNYFISYKYMTIFSLIFFIAGKSACLIFTYWYLQQQVCWIWFCVLFHLSVLTKFILMRRGEYMFWWLNWQFEWNQTCTLAG